MLASLTRRSQRPRAGRIVHRLTNLVRHRDPYIDERLELEQRLETAWGLARQLEDQVAFETDRADRAEQRLAGVQGLENLPERRRATGRPPRPGIVTTHFFEQLHGWQPRLEDEDEVVREAWDEAGEEERQFLAVMLGVWQDAPGFCERTGLLRVQPPEHIHAMARGPLAAGGGFNSADVIAEAALASGVDPGSVGRALDFGGSSGRVVRVMQAAYPGVEWHSCDPNETAIGWAQEHLPAISFLPSPQDPPLPYPDEHFGLVYAVSVWSHFAETAARRWFEEMHRIVREGGILVATTQAWQTTHHLDARKLWDRVDVNQAIADLYGAGHHFRQVFGPGGDHGVESDEWGMGFLSPEWALSHLTPDWQVLWYRPGRLEANQDVFVLRRAG